MYIFLQNKMVKRSELTQKTVVQLKSELVKFSLDTSGKKADLVNRLFEYLQKQEEVEENIASDHTVPEGRCQLPLSLLEKKIRVNSSCVCDSLSCLSLNFSLFLCFNIIGEAYKMMCF